MTGVLSGLAWLLFLAGWFTLMGMLVYVLLRCTYEMVVDTILVILRKPEKYDKRPLNRTQFYIWGPPGDTLHGQDQGN